MAAFLRRKVLQVPLQSLILKAAETFINFTALSMQINFSLNKGFKVASYSVSYLTNGDYIRYLLDKFTWKQSDRGCEEVELFSVLIHIVEAAL